MRSLEQEPAGITWPLWIGIALLLTYQAGYYRGARARSQADRAARLEHYEGARGAYSEQLTQCRSERDQYRDLYHQCDTVYRGELEEFGCSQ